MSAAVYTSPPGTPRQFEHAVGTVAIGLGAWRSRLHESAFGYLIQIAFDGARNRDPNRLREGYR